MNIKEVMLKREILYSKDAAFDKDAIRLKPINDEDIRPNYFRDIDRIIHTSSYTRYMDKTQVFSFTNNDNISKRMIHVQLVSKIARTIGRALSLNEDLIEAIALGHDLGHCPFGHVGERILNEISLNHNKGYFMHNVQSVRTLMVVENKGLGKNITLQVLDGILCHNGEFVQNEYYPKKKTLDEFMVDYNNCYNIPNYDKNLIPMTLEGCVVRISDMIGYLGRDIEDAEKLGMFNADVIPSEISNVLGNNNSSIINTIINDIIKNSLDKPFIMLSDEVFEAIKSLKKFNYDNIYDKANSKEAIDNYKMMFNSLFDNLMIVLKNNKTDNNIYKYFLNDMSSDYIIGNSHERIIIDYMAGMTDDYFMKEYEDCKKGF